MQGTTVTADYGAAAEKLSGTLYWMLQDGQPSTRQLLNSSQAIVASYTTDAFGNNISSSGTAANPFKWNGGSGYYADAESGLQKVGARYYDPSVGNWISQDSMLIAGSVADSQAVNRYLYCGANPVGRVDPGGHNPFFLVVVLLGLLVIVLMSGCDDHGPQQKGSGPTDPVKEEHANSEDGPHEPMKSTYPNSQSGSTGGNGGGSSNGSGSTGKSASLPRCARQVQDS